MRTGFLLDDRKPLRLKDEDVVKWFRHQTLAHFTNNCFDADHSFHGTSSIAKCLTNDDNCAIPQDAFVVNFHIPSTHCIINKNGRKAAGSCSS